ncbi:YrhK family protein [Modestobacter sp. SYSU DS0290]
METDTDRADRTRKRRIGELLSDFPWVHLGLGLVGNTAFFVGSVLFFWESTKTVGIWLFVIGSLGMLTGSVGELVVKVEKRRRRGG